MNEEALNDVFTLSLNAGYTKDLEAFKELMANNEEARADAFSLAVEAGYTKDINAFSELMGAEPGKENVQSAGAPVDGSQAPQGKDGTPTALTIDTDFINRTEEDAINDLQRAYPELKFGQTGFGTDKIRVGEGNNEVIFDFDNDFSGAKGAATAKAMQLYLDGSEKGYKALMVANQKAFSTSEITESYRREAEGETREIYETNIHDTQKEWGSHSTKLIGVEAEWRAFAKESEAMLRANRSDDDPEITEDDIRKHAIELYIHAKRYADFSSTVEEHLEVYGDIHESNLFDVGMAVADVIGGRGAKEMLASSDPQQQARYALSDALGDVEEAKVAEVVALTKELDKDVLVLGNMQDFFEASEPATAEGIDEWNAQVKLFKTAANSFSKNYERLNEMTVEAALAGAVAGDAKRSYETLDIVGANIFNGGAQILAGTMELIDDLYYVAKSKRAVGGPSLEVSLKMDEVGSDSALEKGADWLRAAGNERMSVVATPQSFEEFNSAEDILEWGLEMVSGQVPVLATAMIPYAGLVILGGSSMGNKMNEISDRISKGEDISELQRWGTGLVHAVSEIATEKVKLSQFKAMGRTLRGMKKIDPVSMSTLTSRWGLAGDVAKRWGIGTFSEGGAEGIATLSQNIADIHILGEDKSYWEGVNESFFAGAVLSGGVFQSPALVKGAYDIAMTKESTFNINKQTDKGWILEQEKQELRDKWGPKAKQPDEIKNRIDEINSEQQNIIDQIINIRRQSGENIDDLSRRDKRTLIANDIKLWESKRKIKELQADGNKLSTEKRKELIILETLKIKTLRDKQDRVLNDAAFSKGRDAAAKVAAASNGEISVEEVETSEEAIKIATRAIKDSDLSDSEKETAIEKLRNELSKSVSFNGVAVPVGNTKSIIFAIKGGTNSAVWAHEISHHALFGVLLNNKVDIIKFSRDLQTYMETNIKGSKEKFAQVKENYKDRPADEIAEEILAAAVEMSSARDLNADKNLNAKFQGFRNVLAKAPVVGKYVKDANHSGKDILDLLKEFNIAFESGSVKEFSEGLKENKLTKEYQAKEGNLNDTGRSVKQSRESKDLSKEVQAVWDREGKAGGFEISELYRGMAITRAAKYRNLPLYQSNKDILVDEILTGMRGVYDMVQTYDPSKNDSLSAYINSFLPRRVIEAVNRVLGTEFTEDITERKDIVAAPEAVQVETDAPKVASTIRRKIGLDEKQMNVVRRAVIRALATAPKIKAAFAGKPKAFNDHLVKTYTTLLFKMLKNHMGTGADYRMWVKKNFDVFNNNIGLSTLINGRMSLFYKPVLNEAGVQERMSITEANDAGIPLDKAGAGPAKWQRVSPTPDEFYDWAMGKGMAANTKPARKTTMARLLSREIGLDATMEVLNNINQPDYTEQGIADSDKTVNMLERLGVTNKDQMAETEVIGAVSSAISRHRDLRFDKSNPTYQGHKTPSASYNAKIEPIAYWYIHKKKKLASLDDKKIAKLREKNPDLDNLYKEAIATAKRVRINVLKQDLKDNGIESFIKQSVEARLENTTLRKVFKSNVAQDTLEYAKVIEEIMPMLKKEYGELEAVVMVIRLFQPSGAQRGAKSPWQRNKTFMDKVIAPMIKDLKLGKNLITLGDPKLTTKSGKLRKGLLTFMLNGEKITPAIALEASQGIFLKALNGTLRGRDLAPFNEQARAHQVMITKLSGLMRNNPALSQKTKATFVWGLGNMTRGAGRLAYQYKGILRDGDIIDPLHYTVEHQLPWSEMAAYIALYIEGVIPNSKLQSKWKTAELYLHPTSNAQAMNASGAMISDKHEGAKDAEDLPKRLADHKKPGQTFEHTRGIRHSRELNEEFNNILEESGSIPAGKIISPTEAIKRGKKASRYLKNQGIMVSAAEDFVGLMYKMLAKGKTGEAQLEWLLDKLVIPYDVAVDNVSIARLLKSEQLRKISKSAKLKGMLKAEAFEGMTGEDAVRLYIWNLRGVAKGKFVKGAYVDMAVDYMSKNPELKAYADAVHAIAGAVAYAAPNVRWAHGSIEMDLVGGINGELRALELEQSGWSLNVKEIFSEDNLNKLEALYGVNYVTALKNILHRMKTGRNRIDSETDKTSKQAQGWISNQVGAIMFLNMRSALLQGLSALNYINTTDHNPLQAIRRMLNVPQYAKDTKFLLGSAFMRDRRMGMRIDVNEEDVARASRDTGNVISRALKIALNKGFIPTRLMDTAAIVIGGAGFYRSRINTYVDSGMSIASAEKMAFADFRKATINSQQSSDPRMVSQQQASTMGRFVLQFGNTPGQYTRIQIKAVKDIINGRGDMKAHIGKILYYGMIQQALFTFAQQALWVALLDDDDEWITSEEGRGLVDGMLSSTLRGLGLYGAIIDTAMRTAKVWEKETSKGYMGSNEKVVIEALGISPSVKSIAKKTTNAMNISKYRGDDFGIDPYSLHSPEVEQAAWLLEGTVNIPSKRILDKMHHIESIMSGQNEAWQNIALFFGFQEWQVGTGEGGKKAKQRKLENKGLSEPVKKEKKIKKSISDMTDAEFKAWRIKNPAK